MDAITSVSSSPLGHFLSFATLRNVFIYDTTLQHVIYPKELTVGTVCPVLSTCWFPNEEHFAYGTDNKELIIVTLSSLSEKRIKFAFPIYLSSHHTSFLERHAKYMVLLYLKQMTVLYVLINMEMFFEYH